MSIRVPSFWGKWSLLTVHVGTSLARSCGLHHVSIVWKLWLEESTLWVGLRRHKTIHAMRHNVASGGVLLATLILSVFVKVKRFSHGVRYVLSGLRHTIIRVTVRRSS